jgi:hypothetical protein
MDGVVNEFEPVKRAVPPDAAAYQSIVCPAPGVADIVTDPVPQRDADVPDGGVGFAFIVAVTAVLVAEIQPVVELRACA